MKAVMKFYRLLAFKLRRAICITAFKAQFKKPLGCRHTRLEFYQAPSLLSFCFILLSFALFKLDISPCLLAGDIVRERI